MSLNGSKQKQLSTLKSKYLTFKYKNRIFNIPILTI